MHCSNKNIRKRLTTVVLTVILALSSVFLATPLNADAATYKVNTKYKPSYGVEYKKLDGDINVMEMDISDAFTEVQLGKPDPLDNLMTVKNRANSYNKSGNQIIGAINANFYEMSKHRPVHLISENNRLLYNGYINAGSAWTFVTSPLAFGIDSSGKGLISDYDSKLSYTYNKKDYKISHLNRERAENNTILYTSDFYKKTTDTNKYGTEVILKGPKNPELTLGSTIKLEIDSIRKEGDAKPIDISDNYFVLSGHGTASNRLKKMKVGETIEVNVKMDKKWQGSEFMLAGGPLLVKDGKVNDSMGIGDPMMKQVRARTAVGVDKSRNKVFFVTYDEKKGDGKTGMNMTQLAKLMKDMGADTALNLDGGGSTTMVTLPKGGGNLKVVNKPSAGERRISGILMAADTEPPRIFPDVSHRSDHINGITWLNQKGIGGYPDKTFRAHEKLSRQQSAVMFTKTMDLEMQPASAVGTYFTDIPETKEHADFIATVGKAEIFKGEDGKFNPYEEMTRQQMATTIVNALGLTEKSTHKNINLDNVSKTHKKNVQILADYGITNQLDDFRPYENVTRGQFATFLYQAYQAK